MRQLFILLDISGSVALEGTHKVGQINDLIRDLLEFTADSYQAAYLITYSDIPRIYWQSRKKEIFIDIPPKEFGGRSNLGKAYLFVGSILADNSVQPSNVSLVLISDGEATDNYRIALHAIDPKNQTTRVAGGLGMSRDTLDFHMGSPELAYTDITSLHARDEFFDDIKASLSK